MTYNDRVDKVIKLINGLSIDGMDKLRLKMFVLDSKYIYENCKLVICDECGVIIGQEKEVKRGADFVEICVDGKDGTLCMECAEDLEDEEDE